jgi:hypothetical protein
MNKRSLALTVLLATLMVVLWVQSRSLKNVQKTTMMRTDNAVISLKSKEINTNHSNADQINNYIVPQRNIDQSNTEGNTDPPPQSIRKNRDEKPKPTFVLSDRESSDSLRNGEDQRPTFVVHVSLFSGRKNSSYHSVSVSSPTSSTGWFA